MATYLILNICFIAAVLILLRQRPTRPSSVHTFVLGVLIILTAVFDTLIISFGIVGYDTHKLLGFYIGSAPIEDFFYPVLAVILIPTIWNKLGDSRD